MVSGDRAASKPPARREPDALDMWFARQRRAWWRKWGWLLIPALVLAALRISVEIVNFSYLWWVQGIFAQKLRPDAALNALMVNSWKIERPIVDYFQDAMIIVAAGLFHVHSAYVPVERELAAAMPRSKVYRETLVEMRKAAWLFYGVLVIIPTTIAAACYMALSIQNLESVSIATRILFFSLWPLLISALAEWHVLIRLRFPSNYLSPWLGFSPLVLYIAIRALSLVQYNAAISAWVSSGFQQCPSDHFAQLIQKACYCLVVLAVLAVLWRVNNKMPRNFTGSW